MLWVCGLNFPHQTRPFCLAPEGSPPPPGKAVFFRPGKWNPILFFFSERPRRPKPAPTHCRAKIPLGSGFFSPPPRCSGQGRVWGGTFFKKTTNPPTKSGLWYSARPAPYDRPQTPPGSPSGPPPPPLRCPILNYSENAQNPYPKLLTPNRNPHSPRPDKTPQNPGPPPTNAPTNEPNWSPPQISRYVPPGTLCPPPGPGTGAPPGRTLPGWVRTRPFRPTENTKKNSGALSFAVCLAPQGPRKAFPSFTRPPTHWKMQTSPPGSLFPKGKPNPQFSPPARPIHLAPPQPPENPRPPGTKSCPATRPSAPLPSTTARNPFSNQQQNRLQAVKPDRPGGSRAFLLVPAPTVPRPRLPDVRPPRKNPPRGSPTPIEGGSCWNACPFFAGQYPLCRETKKIGPQKTGPPFFVPAPPEAALFMEPLAPAPELRRPPDNTPREEKIRDNSTPFRKKSPGNPPIPLSPRRRPAPGSAFALLNGVNFLPSFQVAQPRLEQQPVPHLTKKKTKRPVAPIKPCHLHPVLSAPLRFYPQRPRNGGRLPASKKRVLGVPLPRSLYLPVGPDVPGRSPGTPIIDLAPLAGPSPVTPRAADTTQ